MSAVPHIMAGGKHVQQPVTEETKQLALRHRADIASQAGVADFETFEPEQQRTQVVAGLNHFVKIKVGPSAYVHSTIWVKPDQTATVTKVETGKTEHDPL